MVSQFMFLPRGFLLNLQHLNHIRKLRQRNTRLIHALLNNTLAGVEARRGFLLPCRNSSVGLKYCSTT